MVDTELVDLLEVRVDIELFLYDFEAVLKCGIYGSPHLFCGILRK